MARVRSFVISRRVRLGVNTRRQRRWLADSRGNYRLTVFPPPAGKSVEDVRGWGVNVCDPHHDTDDALGFGGHVISLVRLKCAIP